MQEYYYYGSSSLVVLICAFLWALGCTGVFIFKLVYDYVRGE